MQVRRTMGAFVLAALIATSSGCSATQGGRPATPAPGAAVPAGSTETPPAAVVYPVTVRDDASRTVTIETRPARVVSLAPADTEIVAGLGAEGRLVGVTTYDDYPASVKSLPKVGDFTTPNLEAIAALKPDVVLVTTGIQTDVIAKLEKLGGKVVAVDPVDLEGAYRSIMMVGQVLGESGKAFTVTQGMRATVADVRRRVSGEPRTTCFIEIAQNPLYTAGSGTLLDSLVTAAGGTNVVTQAGYVPYSLEQLLKADPQVYLATKGSMNDPLDVAKRPGFEKLQAVEAKRVHALTDDLVSRGGPRVVEGLLMIAKDLHPDAFKGQ